MGDVKRVAITGASGFIGRATVAAALQAGLEVVAVQRSAVALGAGVTPVAIDLGSDAAVPALVGALDRVDAVIHLAAAMSGDAREHARLTIGGTARLTRAMAEAGTRRLILASSIAVFDTSHVPIGGKLTDDCPLVTPEAPRDAYSGAKVAQENLAKAADLDSLAILRPGIVYDADHLWNAHLGMGVGPVLFRIGGDDPLPMCHVDHCAAALVQATMQQVACASVVIDRNLPTRGEVIDVLRRSGWPKMVVPVSWRAVSGLAKGLRKQRNTLPGLLREEVLRQRILPMRYDFTRPDWTNALPEEKTPLGAVQ